MLTEIQAKRWPGFHALGQCILSDVPKQGWDVQSNGLTAANSVETLVSCTGVFLDFIAYCLLRT